MGEAFIWLLDQDPEPTRRVLLKPDSEYTAGVAEGIVHAKENIALAHVVHTLYKKLRSQRRGRVGWMHVKGHSKHKWNDVVDTLAVNGTKCGEFSAI